MDQPRRWACLLFLAMTGCGESAAETYCEEFGACWDKVAGGAIVTQGSVDECIEEVEDNLDELSDAEREQAEELVEQCADHSECAFVVCFCDAAEIEAELCDAAEKHR